METMTVHTVGEGVVRSRRPALGAPVRKEKEKARRTRTKGLEAATMQVVVRTKVVESGRRCVLNVDAKTITPPIATASRKRVLSRAR